jgi:ABC-2 type transport system permease protein
MLKQIIQNEWRIAWRERQLSVLWLLIAALLLFATLSGWQNFQRIQHERQEAADLMRKKWEGQGDQNPHSSAHYGTYVFKPSSILYFLDPGIDKFSGVSLRLEGHVQHGLAFAPAAEQSSLSRFGDLNTGLILQVLVPLLLLFLAFNSVQRERSSGSMRLLLAQGISIRTLLWGKILANWSVSLVLLLLVLLLGLGLSFSQGQLTQNPDVWTRFGGLLLLYAVYYLIIGMLGIQLAAAVRQPAFGLLLLLGVWVSSSIILPKMAGIWAEQRHPLLGIMQFNQQMREEREKGLNGHDPEDERSKRFEQKILAKYQVEKLSALPINYDGLLMQEDEYYGNAVWDKHFGKHYQNLQKQSQQLALASFVNPFQALRNLSLACANTDLYQFLHFQKAAEMYRRDLIRGLNEKMAYGGSKTGDWEWKVSQKWLAERPDFNYIPPAMGWSLQQRKTEIIALASWLLLLCAILYLPWWKAARLI